MDDPSVPIRKLFMKYIKDGKKVDMSSLRSLIENLPRGNRYEVAEKTVDKDGLTIVHKATIENDIEVLTSIMEALTEKEKYKLTKLRCRCLGSTCLHWGAQAGSEQATRYLLEQLCEEKRFKLLAKQDKYEHTCIHRAVLGEKLEMIKLFLSRTPVEKVLQLVEMEDENGKTALNWAQEKDPTGIVRCLREYKEDSMRYIAHATVVTAEPRGVTVPHLGNVNITNLQQEREADGEFMNHQRNPTEERREIVELKEKVDKQAMEIHELAQTVKNMKKMLIRCTAALFEENGSLMSFESGGREDATELRRVEQPEQEERLTVLPEVDEEGLRGTTPDAASTFNEIKQNNKISFYKTPED